MYGNSLYGSALYSSESTTPGEIEIIPPDLMRYLPNYYQTSVVMQNAQTAIAAEVETIELIG